MFPYDSTYHGAAFPDPPASLAEVGAYAAIQDDGGSYGWPHSVESDRTAGPRPNAHYFPFVQRDAYEPPAMPYRTEDPRYATRAAALVNDVSETQPIGAASDRDEQPVPTLDYGSPLDRLLTELTLTQAVLEVAAMDQSEPVPVDLRSIITDAIAAVPSNDGESAFDSPLPRDSGARAETPLIDPTAWEAELGRRILDGCNNLDELLYEVSLVKRAPFGIMMGLE